MALVSKSHGFKLVIMYLVRLFSRVKLSLSVLICKTVLTFPDLQDH